MPELPEVETTRRGIEPHILHQKVRGVVVRQRQLRWPVPRSLARDLVGHSIERVDRRAKYLLIHGGPGCMLLHLGMSGSMSVVPSDTTAETHDHFDLVLQSGVSLRLNDPRRFGSVLWTRKDPALHPLLRNIGPEPLSSEFHAGYLHEAARGRSVAIKNLIMNGQVVAGVGNIYASEALFRAGIRPAIASRRISKPRLEKLVHAVQEVLHESLKAGGTTLRDFVSNGSPGYYKVQLDVYDRAGQPCNCCGEAIREIRLGQRSTFFCRGCQS